MSEPRELVVFDGECHLCQRSVRFILAHEASPQLVFVPLQTAAGARLLATHGFCVKDAETFVLVIDGKAFVRSDAALRLSRYLRGPWRMLAVLRIFPRFFRDGIYNLIARNRLRWFGRSETCMLPTPELRARFLS